MLIEGNQISLKPSEAAWATTAFATGIDKRLEIARDISLARRQAIAEYLPPGIFDGLVALASDLPSRTESSDEQRDAMQWRLLEAQTEMMRAERAHVIDENGQELHTVTVTLPDESAFRLMREQAELVRQNVLHRLINPAVFEAETIVEMAGDPNPAIQALASAELADDEKNWMREQDRKQQQMLTEILIALDGRKPPASGNAAL